MSAKSIEFEKMIKRIHKLLEGQDADITWNEKIPDPDNPKQMRQIDVSIRKENLLNIVECRIHKSKQNVQWIEELIGRRASLNADGVIAVSANGFTSGAINKANRYGIILNDLLKISDNEVKSWTKAIEISLFFYVFDSLEISLYLNTKDIQRIKIKHVSKELINSNEFQAILNSVFDNLDSQGLKIKENREKTVTFSISLSINDFLLNGINVIEIEAKGKVRLEEIKLNMPTTHAYGMATSKSIHRNVYIQKYNFGRTEVINNNGKVTVYLDLSNINNQPLRQFRYLETTSKDENYFEKLEIFNYKSCI